MTVAVKVQARAELAQAEWLRWQYSRSGIDYWLPPILFQAREPHDGRLRTGRGDRRTSGRACRRAPGAWSAAYLNVKEAAEVYVASTEAVQSLVSARPHPVLPRRRDMIFVGRSSTPGFRKDVQLDRPPTAVLPSDRQHKCPGSAGTLRGRITEDGGYAILSNDSSVRSQNPPPGRDVPHREGRLPVLRRGLARRRAHWEGAGEAERKPLQPAVAYPEA